jgi:outer membrane protein OmpA-like peptidoglycan-associated protein
MAGGSSAEDAAKTINNIAKAINAVTSAIGGAIGGITKLYGKLDNFVQNFDPIIGDSLASQKIQKRGRSASPAGTYKRTAQQRLAEADAKKRAKELAALQAKQIKAQKELTAEQKKQALLKKAGTLFDLDQANLIAALKGNLSEEDRKRAELQLALLTGNTKEVQKLTYEIGIAQGLGEKLSGYLASLPDAKNPFAAWEKYLDMIKIKAIEAANVAASVSVSASSSVSSGAGTGIYVGGQKIIIPDTNVSTMPTPTTNTGGNQQASTYVGGTPIYIQIDGKTIVTANQSQSLSGNPSSLSRVQGMFAG